MSAIAAVYDFSSALVSADVLGILNQRLSHRGPNGMDQFSTDRVVLAHWHFWTTPQEVGERQPLVLEALPFRIVLDGRLDNRPELFSKLNISLPEGNRMSDAELMLRAYTYWGEKCLEHFIGDFAFVILDENRGQLFCGRDALGERTLFYGWYGKRLVVASEPWAIVGLDHAAPSLNESALAYLFARRASNGGETLFENVYELLPAHGMKVTAEGSRIWRYWQPDPSNRVRHSSDEEYAEEFRSILEQSVRSRMRSVTPVGVLMSGGLDSGSVACLAARDLAPEPLTTISYVFDELKDADERIYIDAIKQRWNTRSIQFLADGFWPLKNWPSWPQNPNQPDVNPFWIFAEQALSYAQKEGISVLLTGDSGDELYYDNAGIDWAAELLSQGRFRELVHELWINIRIWGLRRTLARGFIQRAARKLVDRFPGGRSLHRKSAPPPWLTTLSCELIGRNQRQPTNLAEQHSSLMGEYVARGYLTASFLASRYKVEFRRPYRDRRLVEYVLAIPPSQLYFHGLNKYILRKAMQGILPDTLTNRTDKTFFNSVFLRGMKREKTLIQTYIQNPAAAWRKLVRPDWISQKWNIMLKDGLFQSDLIVLWNCISYETWYQSIYPSINSL
jgi:asparagine synthase (glutamine-hydrolysing)